MTDLSGLGNDGTLVNFVDTSAGAGAFRISEGWVAEGGLSFLDDGVRSFVETPLPLNALGRPGGGNVSHTIEFLASYGTAQNWTPALGSNHGPSFADAQAFFFGINDPTTGIELRTPSGGGGTVGLHPWQSTGDLSATTHHVAFVYSYDSDELETFVDGQSVGIVTTGFTLNMAQALDGNLFLVGNTGHAAGEQWAGVIQGTAISTDALDADSFVLMHGNQPSTLLHYDYGDGSGDAVTDLSGNGNDGLLVNFANTGAGAGGFGASEGWVSGGGLSFLDDAQRSYVETPLEVFELEDNFTIELLANYASPGGWSPLIGSSQNPFSEMGTMFLGINELGTSLHFRGPGYVNNVADNPWLVEEDPQETVHHIALRFDEASGQAEIFVDGNLLGTVDRSGSDYSLAESLFRIGNTGWAAAEQWDGVIQGVAISDAYLNSTDFVLLQPSLPGDFDENGELNAEDLDLHAEAVLANTDPPGYDLDGNGDVDYEDRVFWLHQLKKTYIGDSNLDFEFNTADFVAVLSEGKYETGERAGWAQGDWNGDLVFGTGDLVVALSGGGYERGPFPGEGIAAVPEPSSLALLLLGITLALHVARTKGAPNGAGCSA